MNDKFTNLDELEDRIDRIKLQWDSRKHVGESPAIDVHLESAKYILEDVRKDFEALSQRANRIETPWQLSTLITAYRRDHEYQRKRIAELDAANTDLLSSIANFKQIIVDSERKIRRLKNMIDSMRKAFDNIAKENK